MMPVLVDSYGWIEFFTDGPLSDEYAKYLKNEFSIITPSVVIYEVYKHIKRERTKEEALTVVAQIGKTRIVPLDDALSIYSAEVSLKYNLPMADAIVYATALERGVSVVTSDTHFENLQNVIFLRR